MLDLPVVPASPSPGSAADLPSAPQRHAPTEPLEAYELSGRHALPADALPEQLQLDADHVSAAPNAVVEAAPVATTGLSATTSVLASLMSVLASLMPMSPLSAVDASEAAIDGPATGSRAAQSQAVDATDTRQVTVADSASTPGNGSSKPIVPPLSLNTHWTREPRDSSQHAPKKLQRAGRSASKDLATSTSMALPAPAALVGNGDRVPREPAVVQEGLQTRPTKRLHFAPRATPTTETRQTESRAATPPTIVTQPTARVVAPPQTSSQQRSVKAKASGCSKLPKQQSEEAKEAPRATTKAAALAARRVHQHHGQLQQKQEEEMTRLADAALWTHCKLKLRATSDLDSEDVGDLPLGASVNVLERQTLDDGTVRARVAYFTRSIGWITCTSKDGHDLLQRAAPLNDGRRRGRTGSEDQAPPAAGSITASPGGAEEAVVAAHRARAKGAEALILQIYARRHAKSPTALSPMERRLPPTGHAPKVKGPMPPEASAPRLVSQHDGVATVRAPGSKDEEQAASHQRLGEHALEELLYHGIPARRGRKPVPTRVVLAAPAELPPSAKISLTTYERRCRAKVQPYWQVDSEHPVGAAPLQIGGVTTMPPCTLPPACEFDARIASSSAIQPLYEAAPLRTRASKSPGKQEPPKDASKGAPGSLKVKPKAVAVVA